MIRVIIIGLGAIGSTVAPLVARLPNISAVMLIDPDTYSVPNRSSQAIDGSDVGRLKVAVQAETIAAINPGIVLQTFAEPVENVPLGYFRNSIVLCCVDNRRARQVVNRIAHRCGVPWINAAVDAPSLVKINVYLPDPAEPCLECSFDQSSYELLEQEYPCNSGAPLPATAAPAELGALAGALQVAELRKLCAEPLGEPPLAGAQLMLDTSSYERHLVQFRRDTRCRFDHQAWRVDTLSPVPGDSTLADLFATVNAGRTEGLGLEGHVFATHIDCIDCGKRSSVGLSIYGRLNADERACSCGGRMLAAGYFSFEKLKLAELSSAQLSLGLAATGIRRGDVISVGHLSGQRRHFQIGEVTVDE